MSHKSGANRWGWLIDYFGLLTVILLMILFFGLQSERFWTLLNAQTIANKIPDHTLIAVGMTYVLIIGGIDLSVGSLFALSGVVVGVAAVQWGCPIPLAMLLGTLMGGVCGLLNGFVSEWWKIPSFIVTLGMLEIARGAELLIADSKTQYIGPDIEYWGLPLPGLGIAPAVFVAIFMVLFAQIVLSKTVFGRYMLAIGNNENAVRLSGIRPAPIKITVFAISGLLAGLAGLIQVSRVGSADPSVGGGYELSAIASVVIGGTSLMGGRGSVVKSFLGVLIIAILDSGLVQMDMSDHARRIITGVVIILAVILDVYRQQISAGQFWNRIANRS